MSDPRRGLRRGQLAVERPAEHLQGPDAAQTQGRGQSPGGRGVAGGPDPQRPRGLGGESSPELPTDAASAVVRVDHHGRDRTVLLLDRLRVADQGAGAGVVGEDVHR